jgi:hypothetical protein
MPDQTVAQEYAEKLPRLQAEYDEADAAEKAARKRAADAHEAEKKAIEERRVAGPAHRAAVSNLELAAARLAAAQRMVNPKQKRAAKAATPADNPYPKPLSATAAGATDALKEEGATDAKTATA